MKPIQKYFRDGHEDNISLLSRMNELGKMVSEDSVPAFK